MLRVVVMLGAPGAGKGTQAVRLSLALSIQHVSTGDLFREHLKRGTPLGSKAKQYMEEGHLVPDDLVVDMLFDRVKRPDCSEGYLLDGYPRTLHQAEVLEERLVSKIPMQVLELEVSDESIVERAAGRLLCDGCGHIQHEKYSPPEVAGICDACGGTLLKREDDRPGVVRNRLAVYHDQTQPLSDYYRQRDMLCVVDGSNAPDEVYEACLACLEEVG